MYGALSCSLIYNYVFSFRKTSLHFAKYFLIVIHKSKSNTLYRHGQVFRDLEGSGSQNFWILFY